MASRLAFVWSVDNQNSKTALFATIFTAMVILMFPFSWWFQKPYPDLTPELLAILWGSYIGSNKVEKWVGAAKKSGPTTPPPTGEDQIPKP